MKKQRPQSELPGRWQSLIFAAKAACFRAKRSIQELGRRPVKHSPRSRDAEGELLSEVKMKLWTQVSEAEFPLTAGKVENLRVSAKLLNGLDIPAGEIFSFWRQLGRTTKRRGYSIGRELREGCLIPNRGGGLCQVTGLLYQAALKAGLEIVERHGHSRLVPGSSAEQDLDATVFWNYVDLRFKADFSWRLEVELDATDLLVRIVGKGTSNVPQKILLPIEKTNREKPSGDCLTCDQIACFRHPSATAAHGPGQGHSAFLLDSRWPEFDLWAQGHSRAGDQWFTPLDGRKYSKKNYSWSPPEGVGITHATFPTLRRSWKQRRLPGQGAARQRALLSGDEQLARWYAKRVSPEARHLVVSQNLLPFLWRMGVLGGRTFDVLMERWPLAELQRRLDKGAERNPSSSTLADFRVDSGLLQSEEEALSKAGRLITPHRAIARYFGSRSWLLDWEIPDSIRSKERSGVNRPYFFLPCSPLGRKGIFDLRESIGQSGLDLVVLGKAREEGVNDFFRQGTINDLDGAAALVLPAIIEHQPRIALRALAMGIPVIASEECGLPEHPLLTVIDRKGLQEVLATVAVSVKVA